MDWCALIVLNMKWSILFVCRLALTFWNYIENTLQNYLLLFFIRILLINSVVSQRCIYDWLKWILLATLKHISYVSWIAFGYCILSLEYMTTHIAWATLNVSDQVDLLFQNYILFLVAVLSFQESRAMAYQGKVSSVLKFETVIEHLSLLSTLTDCIKYAIGLAWRLNWYTSF